MGTEVQLPEARVVGSRLEGEGTAGALPHAAVPAHFNHRRFQLAKPRQRRHLQSRSRKVLQADHCLLHWLAMWPPVNTARTII